MRRADRITGRWAALASGAVLVVVLPGCGQKDFTRDVPKPPVPIQITGVITPTEVTVSPDRVGGGPMVIIVSNQDEMSHTVILEGDEVREQVGPINPDDAATIQTDLPQGRYSVRAGSEQAVAASQAVKPATLEVGQQRPTGEDDLLRP